MFVKPKYIILIVLDTLRADHISCNGYRRKTTPNIDWFSLECIDFKYAFSTCSYTVPSHASIFTGKYPHRHSIGFSNGPPTAPLDNDLFITEILSDIGYDTAGFVSSVVLGRENGGSLMQGFKTYDDCMTNVELNRRDLGVRLGEETTNSAIQWLDNAEDNNFFIFLHYFDVHGPYINKPPFNSLFVDDEFYGKPIWLEKVVPDSCAYDGIPSYQVLYQKEKNDGGTSECAKDANFYRAQYDGGIKYVDDCLGSLFLELKKRGIYDDSMIIVTSDHGEALGENNIWFFHGLTVTMDQVHVPLMIKPPLTWGIHPRKIFEHVSLADIFPTVCHMVGFDTSHLDVDGHALSIQIDATTALDPDKPSRQVVAEIEGQIAYIDRVNMRIVPKTFDVESAKYFHLEHVCATEVQSPYRFAEAERIQTVHRDFFPSIVYDITKSSQLHRYQFASQFAKNGSILNLFCGDPDGPRILSSKARAVTGMSSDKALVDYSKNACKSLNIYFTDISLDEMYPEDESKFDTIVCFLDFTSLSEIRTLIPRLSKVLKNRGTAIFSVPNTLNGSESIYHWDRYYFEPFSLDNLKEILSNNFNFLYWYWQEIYPSFRITPFLPTENPLMNRGCFDQDYAPRPYSSDSAIDISHFVVVCSQTEIDNSAITGNCFSPGHKYCIEKANTYIHSVKSIANEVRTIISRRDSKIQDMATRVAEVQAALKHIHDSNGWKFLTNYYKIRDVLLPQASFRRRILEALWNLRIK